MTAEQMARLFYDTYQVLAPSFGFAQTYQMEPTWDEAPESHRRLMIAVCEVVLESL